jgi:hypothetical protein
VVFPRLEEGSRAYSVVERSDGVRFQVDGGVAGAKLPHDLAHLIVERETGDDAGFWGAVSAGAVFGSMKHLDGRRPPHARDRSTAVLRGRRDGLRRAELVVWLTERVARGDITSPQRVRAAAREALSTMPGASVDAERLIAAARALREAEQRMARLRAGEELVVEWPERRIHRPRGRRRPEARGRPA